VRGFRFPDFEVGSPNMHSCSLQLGPISRHRPGDIGCCAQRNDFEAIRSGNPVRVLDGKEKGRTTGPAFSHRTHSENQVRQTRDDINRRGFPNQSPILVMLMP